MEISETVISEMEVSELNYLPPQGLSMDDM